MEPVASYFKFNPTGAFSVDWYIGKRCNFNCSYCVDYLHDNHSPHVPLKNMKRLVDIIYEKHKNNVFWSLTGGEPTINPDFLDLCRYIKQEKGARFISITTNGSRTANYFIELFEFLDNITLSFHFEHISERVDEYIEKCIQIDRWRREWNQKQHDKDEKFPDNDRGLNQKQMILRFMVYPEKFDLIEKMEDAFKKEGITNIEYRYIRPPRGETAELMPIKKIDLNINHESLDRKALVSNEQDIDIKTIEDREKKFYKPEEKSKIKNLYQHKTSTDKKKLKIWHQNERGEYTDIDFHYNEVNYERKNNFQNWVCWAGVKHLKITPLGDIYIGSCHVGGKRGNIYHPDTIDLPDSPIQCPRSRCTDNLDLKVPKIKGWEHYDLIKDMIEWTQSKH